MSDTVIGALGEIGSGLVSIISGLFSLLAALLIGYLMFNKITPQNISEVMAGVLFMVLALGWGIYNAKK